MEALGLQVAQVPEDLMLEILYRLPVKSLVRFRSICKRWNKFLKSRSFVSMHHKFNSGILKSQLLISSSIGHVFSFLSNDKSATVLSPDLRILAEPNTYVHFAPNSCNGIVCYFLSSDKSARVFLSNPATREFRQLPPSSFHQDQIERKFIRQVGVAFGYDSADIYDFKVLRLFVPYSKEGPPRKALIAEIFTLSSNTWKQLHWGLDDKFVFYYHGFFFEYSFHFMVNRSESRGRQTIVCFDIHTEKFTTMELPSPVTANGRFDPELMVFKEFLSTVEVNYIGESMSLWIMEDYGAVESWTKLYTIPLLLPLYHTSPLLFWTVEDALLIQCGNDKLVSWDLSTKTYDTIKIQGYDRRSRFLVHQETLVSIMTISY